MVHLTLTARHLDLTEALKIYVEEKIRRIERYTMNPISAMVTLMIERYRHIVDISLNIHGAYIQAKGESNEMYSSIDKAVDKIERQMKKYKGKNQRKKGYLQASNDRATPERSSRDVSGVSDTLDILIEEDMEDTTSEKHGTPKTPWALGPIEPLC
jgi:ribosome hibernation promoting factor